MDKENDTQQPNQASEKPILAKYGENPSIILDVCKNEYGIEKMRTNTIDSKVTIISAIVMGAIALIVKLLVDYDDLSLVGNVQGTKEFVGLLLKLFTGFAAFFTFVASLIILLITIATRSYKAMDCKVFFDDKLLGIEKSAYQLEIANKYYLCLEKNRSVNERRCKFYNRSVILLLIGIALLTLFLIFKTFM